MTNPNVATAHIISAYFRFACSGPCSNRICIPRKQELCWQHCEVAADGSRKGDYRPWVAAFLVLQVTAWYSMRPWSTRQVIQELRQRKVKPTAEVHQRWSHNFPNLLANSARLSSVQGQCAMHSTWKTTAAPRKFHTSIIFLAGAKGSQPNVCSGELSNISSQKQNNTGG